ncbi:MAG: hypothetical protein ACLQPV_10910 [Vulcanimicrobiaceae bacterium]
MTAPPFEFRLGRDDRLPYLHVLVEGYAHPDIAEPAGLDLLACRLEAVASPVRAAFELAMRVDELLELRAYLSEINSGNGPAHTFAFAGGLFELAFAPSRRGPVLCAVHLKTIDASHLRLEYLITLEPAAISDAIEQLAPIEVRT